MPKRAVHDMGGNPAGPVDTHEHTPSLVERRIDAMMQLLRAKPRGFWTTDENRRTIESLTPDFYDRSGYYEKWTHAMRGLLVEKGILSEAEIAAKLRDVRKRHGASTKVRSGKTTAPARRPASTGTRLPKAKARSKSR